MYRREGETKATRSKVREKREEKEEWKYEELFSRTIRGLVEKKPFLSSACLDIFTCCFSVCFCCLMPSLSFSKSPRSRSISGCTDTPPPPPRKHRRRRQREQQDSHQRGKTRKDSSPSYSLSVFVLSSTQPISTHLRSYTQTYLARIDTRNVCIQMLT